MTVRREIIIIIIITTTFTTLSLRSFSNVTELKEEPIRLWPFTIPLILSKMRTISNKLHESL